jgi:RHS repeat-associated protein
MLSSTPAAPQIIVSATAESFTGFLFWFHASRLARLIQGRGVPSQRKQEKQTDRDLKVIRLRISPENATVAVGARITFVATPYDSEGNAVGGVKIKWRTQPGQAGRKIHISPRGEVEATAPGSFNVIAEANGVTAEIRLNVRPGVRPNPNAAPVLIKSVSSRDVPTPKVAEAPTKRSQISKSTVPRTPRRSVRQAHPVLPQGSSAGWDDSNAATADDPENGVGNPPGAAVESGAGSGNFQFAAPVVSLPGRGINVALGLAYNSRLWNKAGTVINYDNDRGWPGPGFSLGFGKMLGMGVYNGAMLVDADGTRHGYTGNIYAISGGSHGVLHTTDGSFIDYEYSTGTGGVMTGARAQLPNGTLINYGASGPGGLYPTVIEDANGNYITITYVNNTGPRIDTILDTLGRAITFSYDSNNLLTAITAPGYTSGTRTLVRLHYHQLTLSYAFNGLTASVRDSSPWMIDAIYYPANGTGYWLSDSDSYSSYGMLARVIEQRNMGFSASSLNEMGSVWQGSLTRSETYNYTLSADSSLTDAPTYTSMTERWSRDGASTLDEATTSYEVHENDSPRTTIITLPNGTKSKQLAYNHPGQYDDGLVYHDETYVTETTVLQSSDSEWESGAYGSPRPTRIVKTNERGQVIATTFGYGDQYYGSHYNQVVEVRDYDYGGTSLLRATQTTYQNSDSYTGHQTTSGYLGRHIFNLPLTVSVLASNYSTVVSRTDYAYDESTPADTPGVTHHEEGFNPHTTETSDVCCDWQWDPYSESSYCAQWCPQSVFDPSTNYRGNVTSVTTYADASSASGAITETRAYDITGNVLTASTSCCEQTSFTFNVNTQYAYPTSKTRGSASNVYAQVTTSATYDFNTGVGRSATDANGRQSTTDYDSATLRPTIFSSPTGAHTDYFYDDTEMTVESRTYLTSGQTGTIADDNVKYLNGRGQVRLEKALGVSNIWDYVETDYGSMGEVTQQSRPYRSGTPVFTIAQYDSLGRTTRVTAPDGSVTETYYNEIDFDGNDSYVPHRPDVASTTAGETMLVRDAWGRERWGRTDATGRLVEVVEPNPSGNGSVYSSGLVTTYAYNTLGSLATVTQGAQTRSFKYDSLGRLIAQKLAEMDATINDSGNYVGIGGSGALWSNYFRYENSRSSLVQRLDARGVKTNYWYFDPQGHTDPGDGTTPDALGRLQAVTWDRSIANSGLQSTDPTYVLDAAPIAYAYRTKTNSGDQKDVTQLSSVSASGVSTETYDYDSESRAYQKTLTLSARSNYGFVTTYTFDSLNRVTDILYPAEYGNGTGGRKQVHQDFDIASRLTGLTYDSQTFASSIIYNAASQTTSLNVGSGTNQIAESYSYGATTGLLDSQTVTRASTQLLNLEYDYTNSSGKRTGQLTKITNHLDNTHTRDRGYSYDALGRLVLATGGPSGSPAWTETYAYDRYGNRTSVSAIGTSAKRIGSPSKTGDAVVAGNQAFRSGGFSTLEAVASNSITTPSDPAVSLPTDLIAKNTGVEPRTDTSGETNSKALDDASRSLYKPSNNKNADAAPLTSPPTFSDPNLLAAGVVIRAIHINELRDAINDLRVRFGLSRHTWTKPDNTGGVVATGGAITADPIIEMRTALDQALGPPPSPGYSNDLGQGQLVRAVHIQELRDRVVTGWTASSQIPSDGHASLSYDSASNRITTSGFAYDAAGNQLRALMPGGGGSQRYKYDAANRMVQVLSDTGNTVRATYTYGGSNERLTSDENGYRTYYDCEGGSTIAEYTEADSSSVPAWSKSYVYLGERLLSTLTPNGSGGDAIEFDHPDRLGTRVVSNPTAATSYEQVTLPFGTALNAESTGASNRRFTTYDRSVSTGLDYAYNRHYDPQQGRFTQVDPTGIGASSLGNPQSLNLFAYCVNDPINAIDPSGLGLVSFFKSIIHGIGKILSNKWVRLIVGIALGVLAGAGFVWALGGATQFLFPAILVAATAAVLIVGAFHPNLFKIVGTVNSILSTIQGVGGLIVGTINGTVAGTSGTPAWNPSAGSGIGPVSDFAKKQQYDPAKVHRRASELISLISGILGAQWDAILNNKVDKQSFALSLCHAAQESAFWRVEAPNGTSQGVTGAQGELGLFQLFLSTAQESADKLSLGTVTTEQVRDNDALNTRLATNHLQGLIDRFGGDVRKGLGAYKQGAKNVAKNGLSVASQEYADAVLECERRLRAPLK